MPNIYSYRFYNLTLIVILIIYYVENRDEKINNYRAIYMKDGQIKAYNSDRGIVNLYVLPRIRIVVVFNRLSYIGLINIIKPSVPNKAGKSAIYPFTVEGECSREYKVDEKKKTGYTHIGNGTIELRPKLYCNWIIIESHNLTSLIVYGYESYLENYLGCFQTDQTPKKHIVMDGFRCKEDCGDNYFGLSRTIGDKFYCHCLKNLEMYHSTDLSTCSSDCIESWKHCGSLAEIAIFAIGNVKYRMKNESNINCIYNDTHCPKHCPEGRSGLMCERFGCRIASQGICPAFSDCAAVNEGNFKYAICSCMKGFALDEDQNCKDLDECKLGKCDNVSTNCQNKPGSFVCECKEGFVQNGTTQCIDLDECAKNMCGDNSFNCTNTPGSYHCTCKIGYEYEEISGKCTDINECKSSLCDLSTTTCKNEVGSYSCKCQEGFEFLNTSSCKDIDECEKNMCDENSTECLNKIGTFECECLQGYMMESQIKCKDIDECYGGKAVCNPAISKCHNTQGSFYCECLEGYKNQGDTSCIDIDECNSTKIKCDLETTYCKNTVGSYQCECKDGFDDPKNYGCSDIDECLRDVCDKTTTNCSNSIGSFNCSCKNGFTDMTDYMCQDMDECLTICHHESVNCSNKVGSFDCKCKAGFTEMKNFICKDVDECKTAICDNSTTTCVNLIGEYKCDCRDGYSSFFEGKCQDVDECLENKCDVGSALCKNTVGSFECHCLVGYSNMQGAKCSDINECTESIHDCPIVTSVCINLIGSFECRCNEGFKSLGTRVCEDIDECATLIHDCGKKAICENTLGGYICKCPTGMEKFTYEYLVECQDIDECQDENLVCDTSTSICLNMIPGFMCMCLSGYDSIDNLTCERAPHKILTTSKAADISGTQPRTDDDDIHWTTDEYEGRDYIVFPIIFLLLLAASLFAAWFYINQLKFLSIGSQSSTSTTRSGMSYDGGFTE